MQKLLEYWHLVPILAESGPEALKQLTNDPSVDLVLTDLQMPGMDGMELARAIKKIRPQLPLIVLSSLGDTRRAQFEGLFSAVLTKPLKHRDVSTHIFRLLRDAGPLEEVPAHPVANDEELFATRYPLRILVAEDNPVNQLLATKMLGTLGYTPDTAENGFEVLEKLGAQAYDLVFMDVQMPEMDGLQATRAIREKGAVQPLIIAMTANAMQEDYQECLQAGMDDYVSKPVRIETIRDVIAKWSQRPLIRPAG